MKMNSVISRWVGSLRAAGSAAGIFGLALFVVGCETEPAAEFACSAAFSPRAQINACKVGIDYAHRIGNEADATKGCADQYSLNGVNPESEDAFDRALANANLFHACARGVKGYLDFQEPASRERILQQLDGGTPSAGSDPERGECIGVSRMTRCY